MDHKGNKNHRRLRELLERYLNGSLSTLEKGRIADWLNDNKNHPLLSEDAYRHVEKEIFDAVEARIDSHKKLTYLRGWKGWSVAAAVLLLVGGTVLAILQNTNLQHGQGGMYAEDALLRTIETVDGQRIKVLLPDSSVVYLNGNSRLRYHAHYQSQKERRVHLDEGEAFFDVAHQLERPFIVQTPKAENKVLGTSFNIRLQGDDGRYHLSVNTGEVAFRALDANVADRIVEHGNHLVYDAEQHWIGLTAAHTETFSSWKDNMLILVNTDWQQLKHKLQTWFGVQVHLREGNLKNQYFTATFEKPNLKGVLDALQKINQFNYRIEGKEVYIE